MEEALQSVKHKIWLGSPHRQRKPPCQSVLHPFISHFRFYLEGEKAKAAWEAESRLAAAEEPGLHMFLGPRTPRCCFFAAGRKTLMSHRQRKCEKPGLGFREEGRQK